MKEEKTRTDIINILIDKNHYETYLEIGTALNVNFNKVRDLRGVNYL